MSESKLSGSCRSRQGVSRQGVSRQGVSRQGVSRAAAAVAALLLPAMAMANDFLPNPDALSLTPVASTQQPSSQSTSAAAERPNFLDAMAPESPNIHGFFNSPFKTAYITPRGLVVQDKGLVWQPVVGLVFPLGDLDPIKNLTFVGGIWNSVDTYEEPFNPTTGAWDEMDVFASFSGTVADVVSLNLTYGVWNSPEHAFATEHNLDLKIGYDDSKWWGDSGFSLNPYVDLWWAISGSSTVILGRHGGTGYVEPGIVPTFKIAAVPDYPITLTLPTYVSLGPSNYWDAHHTYGNKVVGVFSTGLNLSVPLSFIPGRYGHWHADAGVLFDYLANNALLAAGGLASGNTNRDFVSGSVGFGVNF